MEHTDCFFTTFYVSEENVRRKHTTQLKHTMTSFLDLKKLNKIIKYRSLVLFYIYIVTHQVIIIHIIFSISKQYRNM